MKDDLFTKKERKNQRKIKTNRDRSKFKKTDQQKWENKWDKKREETLLDKNLIFGRILAIYSENILVDHKQEIFICTLRGLLKKEKTKQKNLIAVGDFVYFDPIEKRIARVEERKSVLSRIKANKEQLLAANLDQVLITTSVVSPALRPALVDRYIIATLKGNMKPIIVVNKIDLLEKGSLEEKLYRTFVKTYRALGFTVICMSAFNKKGFPTLKKVMKGKASVFSGQSGVGKSSLINELANLSLPIGDLIEKTLKGTHTTSSAQLIPLKFGGFCIDTPGIRSFGVWDLQLDDLYTYFPEIAKAAERCKFPNCSHTHEPSCAVQKAVEDQTITPIRFDSYLKLFQEIL